MERSLRRGKRMADVSAYTLVSGKTGEYVPVIKSILIVINSKNRTQEYDGCKTATDKSIEV